MAAVNKIAVPLVVGLLTAAALVGRLQGLRGPDGDLGTDEARLALAAQGVLATGLPKVPSGRIYTRAMINSYLMAPSLWLFGPHDFAARLPSAVVGTALIPVVFVFGRAVAGPVAGLCAAAFAVVQPDLVKWSDKAWMPSLFVLVFVGAAYLLYLGYGHDRPAKQLAGAAAFVVALLVHELAVLLPMAVLATIGLRTATGDRGWYVGTRSLAALGVFGVGLVLFVALGLFLRMGTIAGPTSEFSTYFALSLSFRNLSFYYHHLVKSYPLLLAAATLGIPLAVRSPKPGMLFLYMTMAVGIMTLGFLLYKSMERYGIMLLPLLAIIAAWTLVEGARLVSVWWNSNPGTGAAVPTIALVLVFGLSLRGDLSAAVRPWAPPTRTWLSAFQALGPAPEDLLLSDVPTIVAFYRGRIDYWARFDNYERYGYMSGNEIRDIYTGAVRVGNEDDLQRVVDANPGRRLWYVGKLERFRDHDDAVEPALRTRLVQAAQLAKRTGDGWVILRIELGGGEAGSR
ncbi:MAG: ArnT family glycosyltransferase [Candidatus Methylomirabilaceae bacterium]